MTPTAASSPDPSADLPLSAKARRTREQPISFLMESAVRNPDLISFAAGLVDPQTLPRQQVLKIVDHLLADETRAREALQYGTTPGLNRLRERCLAHIEQVEGKSRQAMNLSPDDLVVTTGSQQALYLIAETLVDPGDIVIAAAPSYFVYTGTLQSFGARVMTVPMDAGGMDLAALEALLDKIEHGGELHRVKFIYCTSYFQNPTGLTLAADRRPRLVEIAKRYSLGHRILILEDAAYRELNFDGPTPPAVKTFDPTNEHVILSMTFSKPFAPGIKTGYAAMPKGLAGPVLQQKGNHDFGSPNLCQQIADAALADGTYAAQVETLRAGYCRRRDATLAALDKHMPAAPGLSWTRPGGGFYVWLTLPEGVDTSRGAAMFDSCVERGVMYVPGAYCYLPDDHGRCPTNHLRLSFGNVPFGRIDEGIERLSSVVTGQVP